MNKRRSLLIDADLELTNQSGSLISLRLESGQGVVELNDAALLRKLIKSSLVSRQSRRTLQRALRMAKTFGPGIDISVAGKRVARIDTESGGGFLCGLMGLPGLRIRPVGLISVLFR
ncbi:MAG: hypothetical protein ABFS39_05685 [Pseudomonadota bacterium]